MPIYLAGYLYSTAIIVFATLGFCDNYCFNGELACRYNRLNLTAQWTSPGKTVAVALFTAVYKADGLI
tara:strand:- start:259 stop:462 length:204 start_codon:yes stop_codon:yes gene_type:complete